jgi:hypothetical protein
MYTLDMNKNKTRLPRLTPAPNMNRSGFTKQIAKSLVGRIVSIVDLHYDDADYKWINDEPIIEPWLVVGYEPDATRLNYWEIRIVNLSDNGFNDTCYEPRRIVKIGRRLFNPETVR